MYKFDEKQIVYDERSSVFVNVGSKYGTGKKQPVGSHMVKREFDPTKGLNRGRLDDGKSTGEVIV